MEPRILTTSEALAQGVTPGVLRGPSMIAPTSGVRIVGACATLVDRCQAISHTLDDTAAFARTTALRLLGVEVPWQLEHDDRIHVVVPRRGARPQRAAVTSHFCGQDRLDVVDVDGLRVTSPAQTWLHLAHALTPDAVVVLGDAMMRRTEPRTTVHALRHLMERTYKMRGLARCRLAIDLLRSGTDSSMETRTRLLLVQAGLPCPQVNRPALDGSGRFLALPDLSYPDLRIAIEYDGDVHRTDPATWRRDVERRQRLEDAGWIIITATADDVIRHPERLVSRVQAARARRRLLVSEP